MKNIKRGILSILIMSFALAFAVPFDAIHTRAASGGVIVIDPGHDAGDSGAIAPDGTQERYLNAQLAYKLAKQLQSRGYDVTFTHTISYATDVPQDIPYVLEYQPNKYDILNQLVPAIKSKNPDMAISVHHNTATSTTANGFESYWRSEGTPAENHQKSQDLGTFVTNQCGNLSYIKPRPVPVQDSMFLVCRSSVPTILFEAGFMSNPSELANLKNSNKQTQMASRIADGIDNYFNKYPSTHVNIPATYESAQIIQDPKNDGIFTAVVYNVQSAHTVKSVKFPYWTPGDTDPTWVDGTYIGNNAWAYTFDARSKPGTWTVHTYAEDQYGYMTGLAALQTTVSGTTSSGNVLISSKNDRNDTFTIVAQNLSGSSSISSVKFPTFAPNSSDAKWFDGAKLGANTWAVTLKISDFGNLPGTYTTHVYKESTSLIGIGIAPPVDIEGFRVDSMTTTSYDSSTETFKVNINNLRSPVNVTNVQVAVWSDPSQKNLVWYNAQKVSDNNYQITVDINNHQRLSGTYYADLYATDERGVFSFVKEATVQVTVPSTKVTVTKDSTESNFTITATNVPSKATSVSFPVWNKTQDAGSSAIWYQGSKISSTSWRVVVPISNHGLSGDYSCDVYAQIGGATTFLKSSQFYVTPSSATSLSMDTSTNLITLTGVSSPAAVTGVKFPVWHSANQSDIYWYTAQNKGNGTWTVTFDPSHHQWNYGTYYIHAYVYDSRGISTLVKHTTVNYSSNTTVTITPDSIQSKYTITASGVPSNATSVSFPVWNKTQDAGSSAIWYQGSKISSTSWRVVVPISNHGLSGDYSCDVYAQIGGATTFLKSSQFYVTPSSATSLSMDTSTNLITLAGVSSPATVTEVKFPVWHNADQSDIYWYTAQNNGNGKWTVRFDPSYHQGHSGTYIIHAYVYDSRGISTLVKYITVDNISGSTLIMGSYSSTKEQMARYYASSGSTYPYAGDPNNSGAADIAGFAQIYLEEGAAEGVRGDIAFCQAMKETGWLRFTGDVKVNQYNFCGLGATGGGNPGNSFANVREGIRAHIQHLKAYGSTAPLNQACVDPRFTYVTRGCAPAFEDLGGHWAPSSTYGIEIVQMFRKMMTM